MMKIEWSPKAQRRATEALEYCLKEFGNRVTDRFAEELERKALQLSNNPDMGPIEPLLHQEETIFRYLLVKPYKLIYYVDRENETIYIVTLFHTLQAPQKLQKEI